MNANTWYVLSNENGEILAVYGSALETMAKACADQIKQDTGIEPYWHHIFCANRPKIGQSISMKGKET